LQDNRVLTASEVSEIKLATDAYNVTIKAAADSNSLAFVDTASILNQLNNGGIRFGNFHMTAAYVTGGTFSLDGVHPSPRGYALIANKFIEAINAKYGSNLKGVDLGLYGIQYPATIQ
jgi:lysophospholipase L1-like esterase